MSTGWPPTSAKTKSVVTTNSRIALRIDVGVGSRSRIDRDFDAA